MKRTIVWSVMLAVGVFAVLAGKFGYIQLIQSHALQEDVVEMRVRQVKELPERGEVVDQQGKIMAMSLNAKDIAIYPNMISSEETRQKVADLLGEQLKKYGVTPEQVMKKMKTKGKEGKYVPWQGIARRVEPAIAKRIQEEGFAGIIEVSNSPKRYYPNGRLASSILGYVNHNNEPGSGIELSLNRYLSGTPGYTLAEMDYMQKQIPIGYQNISSPVAGQKVTLTLDSYIQYVLEKRLEQGMKEMKPKAIHAVILDPSNGNILAMASTPSFDPNRYTESPVSEHGRNAASYPYEPGSTFKPIYMAMALEGGYINGASTWYDGRGSINVQGANIKNFDGRALGQMSLEDIITNSSNVGMIHISQTMTSEQTIAGLKKAGIGTKTGVELPNEERGLFPTVERLVNDPQAKATISFGQGISTTPIQIASAFSSVINGGHKIKPTLVHQVEDAFGNVQYKRREKAGESLYSDKTVSLMKSYLKANSEKGSGKDYQIPGYDAGSKTGSAWKVEDGRYKSGAIVGSFLGFVPYEKPQYVMLVVVDEPEGIEFGGPSAGPIFKDVMTEVMRYKTVPHTKAIKEGEPVRSPKEVPVPNMEYFLFDDAKRHLEESVEGVRVEKEGEGEVVYDQEYAYSGSKLVVTLITEKVGGSPYQHIPHLRGKTKSETLDALKKSGIKAVFHGEGVVLEQGVKAGRYIKAEKKIHFWLGEK